MATIGTFTKSGNDFTGTVKTLTVNVKAKFSAVANDNDKARDYRVTAGSQLNSAPPGARPHGRDVSTFGTANSLI